MREASSLATISTSRLYVERSNAQIVIPVERNAQPYHYTAGPASNMEPAKKHERRPVELCLQVCSEGRRNIGGVGRGPKFTIPYDRSSPYFRTFYLCEKVDETWW